MSEKPEPGAIVIIEHPYMLDRHSLARVVKVGKVMWEVEHRGRSGWERAARRKVEMWDLVPEGADPDLLKSILHKMAEDLHSSIAALRRDYRAKVAGLHKAHAQ